MLLYVDRSLAAILLADVDARQTRTAKGFAILSLLFFLLVLPIERLAAQETELVESCQLAALRTTANLITSIRDLARTGSQRASN